MKISCLRYLIILVLFLIMTSCKSKFANEDKDKQNKSIEELKQAVLSKACDASIKQMYEQRIKDNEKLLTPQQFKKNLQTMLEDIKC